MVGGSRRSLLLLKKKLLLLKMREEERKKKLKRRFWVHPLWMTRKTEGEFHTAVSVTVQAGAQLSKERLGTLFSNTQFLF